MSVFCVILATNGDCYPKTMLCGYYLWCSFAVFSAEIWNIIYTNFGLRVLTPYFLFYLFGQDKRHSHRGVAHTYFWRSWDRASLKHSFYYNQQDATLHNILYYCQCSTCFRRFLRPSSGAQKLYTQHRVYATLTWVIWNDSPTLAVTASKLGIYPMLCVQCLSSWWWAEKPPETCTALTVIKNIV